MVTHELHYFVTDKGHIHASCIDHAKCDHSFIHVGTADDHWEEVRTCPS